MNIAGLDYNTQREKLVLPEYGREIQCMINHALTIKNRRMRQHCVETIIAVMRRMFPGTGNPKDQERKLWDHLAIMSGFQLDIDYPFDVEQAVQMAKKPAPMEYPMSRIPVRHYGLMLFELFERLKKMPPGRERDEMVKLTANQMRRNLMQWSHGSSDVEKVASDLARFTDGKIQLDLKKFRFERIMEQPEQQHREPQRGQRDRREGSMRNNKRRR